MKCNLIFKNKSVDQTIAMKRVVFSKGTCKWLFMCEIFSPFTPIICSILFGVASATSQVSEKGKQDSNTNALHILSLLLSETVTDSKPERHWSKNKRTKKLHENLRFLPPRTSTVWTKYRWSAGVHRSRGSSDLLYCLTPILSDEQDFIFFYTEKLRKTIMNHKKTKSAHTRNIRKTKVENRSIYRISLQFRPWRSRKMEAKQRESTAGSSNCRNQNPKSSLL